MTPEREAEIRAFAAMFPHHTFLRYTLDAYDAERVARGRSEHAWADERDAMKAQRDTAQMAWSDAVNRGAAVMDGSALREARAEATECRRRAGDAEERAGKAERERDEARAALTRIAATIGCEPDDDDDLCEAVRIAEQERVAAVEYADRRDIASQSVHGVPVAAISATRASSAFDVLGGAGPWRDDARCPRCDRAVASEADFARDPRPGDDALCWDGVACRETDWRARALAAETSTVEWREGALAEAKALGRVIGLREALAAAMEPTDERSPWKAREAVIERIRRLLAKVAR